MRPGEIEVERASRRFRVAARHARTLKELFVARGRAEATDVWALRDVSVSIEPGEAVGLVGRNGSGKSTLLRLIAGILRPTAGRVAAGGRVGSLLELGAGFHPDFSGRENVFLNGSIHGLRRAVIRERMDEIVAFAELEHAIDLPVRTYSSGMYMRLGFAIAAHLDADTLLLDEAFAVGDEAFQRKCFGKIFEFKQRGGTIVFVSHDASAVERLCERAVLLRDGVVALDGRHTRRSSRIGERSPRSAIPTSGAPGCASGGPATPGSRLRSSSGRRARSAGSTSPASRSRSASALPPSARSRRRGSPSSCATIPASCSRRRSSTPPDWAGTRAKASASSASTSSASRSPTGASTCVSGSRMRAARTCCTGSTTR